MITERNEEAIEEGNESTEIQEEIELSSINDSEFIPPGLESILITKIPVTG